MIDATEGQGSNMTKKHKVPRMRRAAPANGAARSVGRPTMFAGKDLTRHRTTYLTPDGWAAVEVLREYHAKKVGFAPSDGDIFEDAVIARAADVARKR